MSAGATVVRLPDGSALAAPPVTDAAALAERVRAALPALDPALGEGALAAGLAGTGEVLRWRRYRATFLLRGGPLGSVHVKVYRPKDAVDRVLGLVLPSRGVTSWRMACRLREAGLPTPEPLLLLQCAPKGQSRWTVLLTRPLDPPVTPLMDELERRRVAGEDARRLLREVARLVARFHDAGFFHGDLTANNVLLAPDAGARPDGAPGLWLIDLDRTKSLRRLPAAVRLAAQVVDLRMLLLSSWRKIPRRAWLRLFVEYARARGIRGAARTRLAGRVFSARRGRIRLGARPRTGPRVPWGPE